MFRSLLSVFVVLLTAPLFGQVPQADNWNEKIQQLSFIQKEGAADYRMGSGDLIEISVFGVDGLNRALRINGLGEITMPYVGTLHAAGLTPGELEQKLRSLMEGRLVQNPQVTVFVKEYRSQPVYILGAVRSPGQYLITQRLNLIDAIAMAGGLDAVRAGEVATVQRRPISNGQGQSPPDAKPEILQVDLRELLEKGNLALNVPLQGGDVIHVPERVIQRFYIIGEVNRPGVFELPSQQEVFLTQALAWAGGPMKTAKTKKGLVVRYDDKGRRQEMAVNLDDILKGRKPDFAVQPNDVVFVPGSTFKNIGYGLLGVIPNTVSGGVGNVVR